MQEKCKTLGEVEITDLPVITKGENGGILKQSSLNKYLFLMCPFFVIFCVQF